MTNSPATSGNTLQEMPFTNGPGWVLAADQDDRRRRGAPAMAVGRAELDIQGRRDKQGDRRERDAGRAPCRQPDNAGIGISVASFCMRAFLCVQRSAAKVATIATIDGSR